VIKQAEVTLKQSATQPGYAHALLKVKWKRGRGEKRGTLSLFSTTLSPSSLFI